TAMPGMRTPLYYLRKMRRGTVYGHQKRRQAGKVRSPESIERPTPGVRKAAREYGEIGRTGGRHRVGAAGERRKGAPDYPHWGKINGPPPVPGQNRLREVCLGLSRFPGRRRILERTQRRITPSESLMLGGDEGTPPPVVFGVRFRISVHLSFV